MPDRETPGREPNGDRGDGLERELRELGARLDYPPTPDLAGSIRRRIEEDASRAAPRRSPPVWAIAAALLAVFIVVPAISFAVFEPFGGGGMSGGEQAADGGGEVEDAAPERAQEDAAMEEAPSSAEPESDSASSAGTDADLPSSDVGQASRAGEELGLGERISLETAEVRMGGLLLPSGLGRPDEVYAAEGPKGNGVAFVYEARRDLPPPGDTTAGLVLTELPGDVEAAFGTGARTSDAAEEVEVGGERGTWVPTRESPGADAFRLTEGLRGSTLLFTRGDVALRLESGLAREDAVQLAESIK